MTGTPTDPSSAGKWLLLAYVEAGDTSQFDSVAVLDLREIELAVAENPDIAALVQFQRKWPAAPQRFLITHGAKAPRALQVPADLEMGSAHCLGDFLSAGDRVAAELGADKTGLILLGHNYGLGFGRRAGGSLTIREIGHAMSSAVQDRGGPLDLLIANTCTFGYIEAAYQLRNTARYLVASQLSMPFAGFPYRDVFRNVRCDTTPAVLGRQLADYYVRSFYQAPGGQKVGMAVLDLQQTDPLKSMLRALADCVHAVIRLGQAGPASPVVAGEIRDVFLANPVGDVRPVLDLKSLADDLAEYCTACLDERARFEAQDGWRRGGSSLRTALEALRECALGVASLTRAGDGALVHYAVADPGLADLCGVGVFAPFVVQGGFRRLLGLEGPDQIPYADLAIFEDDGTRTRASLAWAELVEHTLLTTELDEALDREHLVREATSLPEGRYVSAADAAFNILDRVVDGVDVQVAADVTRARLERDLSAMASFTVPSLRLLAAQDGWTARWRGVAPAGAPLRQAPLGRHALLTRLLRVEAATQLAEHSVLQMIVHGNFGLGPKSVGSEGVGKGQGNEGPGKGQGNEGPGKGQGNEGPGKGQGNEGPGKGQGNEGPGKGQGNEGPGKGQGNEGYPLNSLAMLLPSGGTRIRLAGSLIGTVADALREVEGAVLEVEALAGSLLLDPEWDLLSPDALDEAVRNRLEAAFALLRERVRAARLTVRHVLEHGALTLGGDDGLLELEREQIAMATGLSRRGLVLLRHRRVRES